MSFFCFSGSPNESGLNASLLEIVTTHLAKNNIDHTYETMKSLEVPPYSHETEEKEGIPTGAKQFSKLLSSSKGTIISSPEYNCSVPGNVKNLLDWVSRIKPCPLEGSQILLLSASPSNYGGNRGLLSLRIPLEHLGAFVYPKMHSIIKAHETLGDQKRKESLLSLINTFVDHVP